MNNNEEVKKSNLVNAYRRHFSKENIKKVYTEMRNHDIMLSDYNYEISISIKVKFKWYLKAYRNYPDK